MPTRVYLVRHGATTLSAEDRFAGETDVDLSDGGRTQLRHLAGRLAHEPLCAVYASPMRRTLESAEILSEPHGLPVVPVPALREISHGRWETKMRREVEALWPEEYARWDSDPYTFAPEGGESGLAVTARAFPALADLVAAQAGRSFLVVSHKATIRLLLSVLIGIDPRFYRDRLDQSPACLNVLDFKDPSHARLTLFNDVSHYASGAPEPPTAHLSSWWDGAKI
jgi:broad specificity phosphatase PhoE